MTLRLNITLVTALATLCTGTLTLPELAKASLSEIQLRASDKTDRDEFGTAVLRVDAQAEALLALDLALTRLDAVDERLARVVELRFFGGLSVEETAEALGVSTPTVKRDTRVARAFLYREMEGA